LTLYRVRDTVFLVNCLTAGKRSAVVAALVEGVSINATCRMTVANHTVLNLLRDIGCACAAYHNVHVRNLRVRRVQADEIWSFVYGKDKNLTLEQVQSGLGSVWTWKAIDADTKLVISYTLGDRGADTAKVFMQDVASRINSRIQLTTDGHRVYAEAVEDAFGSEIDYVGMRRFTRLTNGFSKKVENHGHMVALYFMHYNFCRVHKTLRVIPAMEAGLSDHIWDIEGLIQLLRGKTA